MNPSGALATRLSTSPSTRPTAASILRVPRTSKSNQRLGSHLHHLWLIEALPYRSTSATWLVNAAGGKEVSVQLYDANGVSGSLLSIPVTNGTDTSCVVCASFMGVPYC